MKSKLLIGKTPKSLFRTCEYCRRHYTAPLGTWGGQSISGATLKDLDEIANTYVQAAFRYHDVWCTNCGMLTRRAKSTIFRAGPRKAFLASIRRDAWNFGAGAVSLVVTTVLIGVALYSQNSDSDGPLYAASSIGLLGAFGLSVRVYSTLKWHRWAKSCISLTTDEELMGIMYRHYKHLDSEFNLRKDIDFWATELEELVEQRWDEE